MWGCKIGFSFVDLSWNAPLTNFLFAFIEAYCCLRSLTKTVKITAWTYDALSMNIYFSRVKFILFLCPKGYYFSFSPCTYWIKKSADNGLIRGSRINPWIGLDRIVKYQYTPDTDWIGLRFSGLDRTGFWKVHPCHALQKRLSYLLSEASCSKKYTTRHSHNVCQTSPRLLWFSLRQPPYLIRPSSIRESTE